MVGRSGVMVLVALAIVGFSASGLARVPTGLLPIEG